MGNNNSKSEETINKELYGYPLYFIKNRTLLLPKFYMYYYLDGSFIYDLKETEKLDYYFFHKNLNKEEMGFIKEEDVEKYNVEDLYKIQDGHFFSVKNFNNRLISNKYENLSVLKSIDTENSSDDVFVYDISIDDLEKINGTTNIRKYLKQNFKLNIDSKYKYIFFFIITPDIIIDTFKDCVNAHIGYTIKDLSPSLYSHYMIHLTENFDKIFETGMLCNYGNCEVDAFNEKTGKFNYKVKLNPRERREEMPGIYFSKLDYSGYVEPMNKNSEFRVINDSNIYGNIGFVYSTDYLFSNYHVNLKGDEYYGYGRDISINDYFNIHNGECIVRANRISIDKISALIINMLHIEIKYINDILGSDNVKFSNVINLYLKNPDKKWYIRKSNLLKVLKNYKKLPLIFIFKKKYNITPFDLSIYNTKFDTDSE